MPLLIVQNDVTKMSVDAIVTAAGNSLPDGGADVNGCDTGDAKITDAGSLPCRYVIRTAGPVWHGGSHGEEPLLRSCYRRSLSLASEHQCSSVAFPLISSGNNGYPKDQVLSIAVDEIRSFLLTSDDMLVYIVIYDRKAYTIDSKIYNDLLFRIGDMPRFTEPKNKNSFFGSFGSGLAGGKARCATPMAAMAASAMTEEACEVCDEERSIDRALPDRSLDQRLNQIDESFSSMLLRKIDESGMTDVECYKRANIDRKLFSKIRSDTNYRPSKVTVIAFAIALRLSLAETREMLMKAGFALSRSNKFDIIIEYFIENGNYDVFDINEALFAFDQTLLA